MLHRYKLTTLFLDYLKYSADHCDAFTFQYNSLFSHRYAKCVHRKGHAYKEPLFVKSS